MDAWRFPVAVSVVGVFVLRVLRLSRWGVLVSAVRHTFELWRSGKEDVWQSFQCVQLDL